MHVDQSIAPTANHAEAMNTAILIEPARHFCHPRDVVSADRLSLDDKRAILASWASDFYVVGSKPALRLVPGLPAPISYDEVLSALKSLDGIRDTEQGD